MAVNHTNDIKDDFLFDETILNSINFEESQKKLNINITPTNLGENYILRPLSSNDYKKGYIELLAQLTTVGNVTEEMYLNRFQKMKECPNTYYIVVIENTKLKKLVAASALFTEQKFTHELPLRGQIWQVIVDKEFRGKHFGTLLVETMTLLGILLGCYKIILWCMEDLFEYYDKFGFKKDAHNLLSLNKINTK